MAAPGSYRAGEAHRDLTSEIERLRAQALMHWDKETEIEAAMLHGRELLPGSVRGKAVTGVARAG